MRHVKLAENCGLKVSVVSLGTWHLPRLPERDEAGAYKIDYEEFKRVLKKAYDEGLTFIDTANRYHGGITPVPLTHVGNAERLLGRAIRELGLDREELVVATKVAGRMSPGPNGAGLSRKHIMWQIRESLKRLQMEYVDVYYAHVFDPDTPKLETLTTFNDLVRQGLVRYLGMSNIPAHHLVEYVMLAREWRLEPIVVLQYRYNLLDRSIERDIIPIAKRFGMGVAAYSPLAQGLLTGKYVDFEAKKWVVPPLSRGTYQDFSRFFTRENLELMMRLNELAREKGITMAQLATAWVINMGERVWGVPIVPIVGVSRLRHLEEAIEAADVKLSHDDLKALDELVSGAKIT
ncbi:MAG: aldo/keto reductase [Thermoprotei archaeon]|nr:MAG: aldo/keto reductase [Thermoprotei archaeon]